MRIGRRNINANKKKGREGRDGGSKERIRNAKTKEKIRTQKKRPCGRGWRLHTSQKMPRATGRWKRTGRILPQGFWREYGLADTSILDFWPSKV